MTSVDVNDVLKRTQSTANGSTTDFSFSFQVNATGEIRVYEDSTLKTEGTHYDIVNSSAASGLNANGTGVVKFKTSPTDYTPANNKVITILSLMGLARTSVYSTGQPVTAGSLEADFDKIHRILGDFKEAKSRTLVAPEYSPTDIDMTIPSKASRLGKILGFNSSTGNPEMYVYLTNENTVALDGLTAGTVTESKYVLVDANKDIGTFRNVTLSGALTSATLDISGNADIDGTLEADAITVDGTALNEYIADTVGAMVGSNTETGVTVTYEDGDNTLDFALGASQTTITSLLATDIKIGEDDQTKIDFETADTINFYAGNEKQLILTDGALTPGSNAIVDLGTDALEFKDAYFDGTVEADAYTVAGTALATYIRDTVGTNMLSSNTETGIAVSYDTTNDNIDFALEASQTVFTSITNTSLVIGRDADNDIDFATDNTILFRAEGADQIKLVDGALAPVTDNDVDLGTSGLQFKDAYIHGTLEADAITIGGTTLSETIADTVGAMVSSNTETGISVTYEDGDNTLDFVIGAGSIVNSMLADDAVGADELASDAVVTASIVADAVTGAKIADDQINSEHYIDGSIDTAHIADLQVTTAKIANDAITEAKIADSAIENEHINNNVISGQAEITTGLADADELLYSDGGTIKRVGMDTLKTYFSAVAGNSSITTVGTIGTGTWQGTAIASSYIASDAITGAKIADDAINSEHYTDGSIDTAHIGANQVTQAKIADDAVGADQLASSAVVTTSIVDDNVTQAKIADDAVGADQLASSAVVTASIVDNAVTLAKMAGLARGKLITGDSSGDPAALAIGTNGQYLKSDGNDLVWGSATISGLACDDLTVGDSAVTLSTSSGNITIDAQGNDTDIIFKGTDGSADTTFLTIDGSDAGTATFNSKIVATELDISGNIDVDGTANLDVVDIDGAVDMASTLAVGGAVTVTTGSSGASANAHGDELVVQSSGRGGISILTPDANESNILFGSASDNLGGFVTYKQSNTTMELGTSIASGLVKVNVADGTLNTTFEADGDVKISNGDIVFGTAGKGINLGVTSNTDSNTLDDYEEGTWTPVVNGMTSISYNNQLGKYTKVGNKVTVHVYLRFTATASGNLYISGLPFNTANETVNDAPYAGVGYQNCEGSVTINGFFNVNNDRIGMVESDNASADWACPNVSGAYLFVTGTYFA